MVGLLNNLARGGRGLLQSPQMLLGLASGIARGDTIGEGLGLGFAGAARGQILDRERTQEEALRQAVGDLDPAAFGSLAPLMTNVAQADPKTALSLATQLALAREKAKITREGTGMEIVDDPRFGTVQRDKRTGRLTAVPLSFERKKELAQAGGTNITVEGDKAGAKAFGKETATRFFGARDAANKARTRINNLTILENKLGDPNLYTGPGGGVVQSGKEILQTVFGADVKGVSAGEVADRVSKQFALGLQSKLDLGRLSDGDRRFLLSLPPSITTTPDGNRRLLAFEKLAAEKDVGRAEVWGAHRQPDGTFDTKVFDALDRFERLHQQRLEAAIEDMRQFAQAAPRSPFAGVMQQIPGWSRKQLNRFITNNPIRGLPNEVVEAASQRSKALRAQGQ